MISSARGGFAVVKVPFPPIALLAAWRPTDRVLVLPVHERVPAGLRRMEARITVLGLGAAATITGRVVSARQTPTTCFVELAPDAARVKTVEGLVAVAASGAPASYPPREPRVLAAVPAVVLAASGTTYMSTLDVSANGCALAWTGPAPTPGTRTALRLGGGKETWAIVGEVRWTRTAGGSVIVGVRITGGDREAWARMHRGLGAALA